MYSMSFHPRPCTSCIMVWSDYICLISTVSKSGCLLWKFYDLYPPSVFLIKFEIKLFIKNTSSIRTEFIISTNEKRHLTLLISYFENHTGDKLRYSEIITKILIEHDTCQHCFEREIFYFYFFQFWRLPYVTVD